MNQSIRCEPPLFPLASDKAAVAGAALFSKAGDSTESGPAEFHDVLESEIEEQVEEKREPKNPEMCAGYVVVPTVIQILQEMPVAVVDSGSGGASSTAEPLAEVAADGENGEKGVPKASSNAEKGALPLIETLKPAEHKLPQGFERAGEKVAEFAENKAEPAKIARGTVGAQDASMLSAKPTSEETAPKQNLLLGSENFEASSFEQPITIKAAVTARESTKREVEFTELPPTEAVSPEWSSFEGLTESLDIQAPKPVKGIEVAEAIRTHVQLLKSSGQEKLEVVLRPDANTELRLHVEKVNGQVLVQARCDRGDIARLEANWSAIQQTLANQGVRVEALQHGGNLQNQSQDWNHSSNTSQQQTSRERATEQNFVEQKTESPKGTRPQPTRANIAVRGWQSWA
jgi:GTP cyclohydrolase II